MSAVGKGDMGTLAQRIQQAIDLRIENAGLRYLQVANLDTERMAMEVASALVEDGPSDFREERDDWATWAAVYKAGRDDAMQALRHERRVSSERLAALIGSDAR